MKRGELDDLVAFATIARMRSFTRAAAQLGVSPSALSHSLRELELRLNVRLLARTTRSVATTAAGERLLRSLTPALMEVEAGLEALSAWRGEPSGTVRITAAQLGGQMVLAPVLPQFLAKHPKVKVEIHIESRMADLVRGGYDAGIRWGQDVEQDMVAVRVGPPTGLIVVGTPAYFEGHPPPKTPADLERHNCLNYGSATNGGVAHWALQRDGKESRSRADGQIAVTQDPGLVETLVLAGAGLGMILKEKARPHLASGQLVHVLPEWNMPLDGFHIYFPSREVSSALRALVEALRWKP